MLPLIVYTVAHNKRRCWFNIWLCALSSVPICCRLYSCIYMLNKSQFFTRRLDCDSISFNSLIWAHASHNNDTCHHAAVGVLSMRHAAAFYALAPPELLQPIHHHQVPLIRVIIKSNVTSVSISFSSGMLGHMQALLSSITLTESALSSPRAAEPGAAAFSRSARARSFYNCPGFTPLCSRLAYPALKQKRENPPGAFRCW